MNRRELRVRKSYALVLTATIVAFLAGAGAFQPAVAESGEAGAPPQELASNVQASLNDAHANVGLGSLIVHPLLNQAAQTHANDILSNYNYSHWGTDGTLAQDRVARTGYTAAPWVSENWISSSSAAGAMRWWMNDYIHRVNILNPRWVEVGIGAATRPETGEMVLVTVFSAGAEAGKVVSAASAVEEKPAEPAMSPEPVTVPAGGMDYSVQAGDTLMGIAVRHGIDWPNVAAANGLAEDALLQIGQIVHVPGLNASGALPSGSASDSATGGEITSVPYTVEIGDTLFSIAARNGLTWQRLAAYNGMTEEELLSIGQVIHVPSAAPAEVAEASLSEPDSEDASNLYYIVQAGDTIIAAALDAGVDWRTVLALNGLAEDSVLLPGQQIRLR